VSVVALAAACCPRSAAADDAPTFADRSSDDLADADAATGFSFDPLAMACGIVRTETDLAIGRSLALNLHLGVYRRAGAVSGLLGAGVLIYPSRPVFHGLYLEPRIMVARVLSENLASGAGSASVAANVGWQWSWDYGLTLRVGAGLAASTHGFVANAPRFERGGDDRLALVATSALGWLW
jgi:hypothetical protein